MGVPVARDNKKPPLDKQSFRGLTGPASDNSILIIWKKTVTNSSSIDVPSLANNVSKNIKYEYKR